MKRILTLLLLLLAVTSVSAQGKGAFSYACLELDAPSHEHLVRFAEQHLPWEDANIIAHHMTIVHHTGVRCELSDPNVAEKDYVLAWTLANEGKSFCLIATEVGYSDKAFALRITDVAAPSRNRIKHITLATNNASGGKAVDSNYITHWEQLDAPILLTGKVTLIYK